MQAPALLQGGNPCGEGLYCRYIGDEQAHCTLNPTGQGAACEQIIGWQATASVKSSMSLLTLCDFGQFCAGDGWLQTDKKWGLLQGNCQPLATQIGDYCGLYYDGGYCLSGSVCVNNTCVPLPKPKCTSFDKDCHTYKVKDAFFYDYCNCDDHRCAPRMSYNGCSNEIQRLNHCVKKHKCNLLWLYDSPRIHFGTTHCSVKYCSTEITNLGCCAVNTLPKHTTHPPLLFPPYLRSCLPQ